MSDTERKPCSCVCNQEVAAVPEIRCRGPFKSQTGHIHSGIHKQEENGHNAGNGVELPREKDQLVKNRESGGVNSDRGINHQQREKLCLFVF